MTVDEAARLRLYEHARRTFDDDAAETLMDALPWDPDRSVTKDDLAVSSGELRTEMADLKTDLRTEMADLRTELRTGLADVRGELRTGLADVRGEIKASAADVTRTLMFGMIASNATLVGLVFAAVKLA